METFEIHITGSQKILDKLKQYGLKSLTIQLLTPQGNVKRTQFMSSIVAKFDNIDEAIKWTEGFSAMLEAEGVEITRKKIETPFYEHYRGRALYIESHWEVEEWESSSHGFAAISRIKDKLLATRRTYDSANYDSFRSMFTDIEMCLYDTWTSEDKDWFDLYA